MDITILLQTYPKIGIFLISLGVTAVITILTYFFTDRQLMKNIKEKQKALRLEMKKFRDNPQKMMELNKQMMEDFPNQMKQSLKISAVTIIPMLILFRWMTAIFAPVLPSWIWWYIGTSIACSIILRKVFKLD